MTVTVKIDRPMGSKHPEHGFVYDVDYGFIPGVEAPDGEELDAYVLGVKEEIKEFTGLCIAVVKRHDDIEDKLIVVPHGKDFTTEEIMKQIHFQERFFKSEIIR